MHRRLKQVAQYTALLALSAGCALPDPKGAKRMEIGGETITAELVFQDDFDNFDNFVNLCPNTEWAAVEGKLIGRHRAGGSTVWCRQDFAGDLLVEFDGRLLAPEPQWISEELPDGGKNLNFRFLATGPRHEDILTVFRDLLAEGTGPNAGGDDQYNAYFFTWTWRHARLRWSPGYKKMAEKLDYLPEVEKDYHFRCLKIGGRIRYWINDVLLFDWTDPNPHNSGKIGFTLWRSAAAIDNLRVYRVKAD
ncbi:MAG: DUF1961 family protein [Kiritimatiellae bacterium]|nr:DUF1961 family protein [Kiritimatiellia bacterium]